MSTLTSRLSLVEWVGADVVATMRTGNTTNMAILDNASIFTQGTLASRPAAATAGRYYLATDDTSAGSSIGTLYFDTGAAWVAGFNPPSRGATNIAASQSTASASYTTLGTPDQVTGIVLPTNGLIRVWYQAQCTSTAASNAAIFLGSNQLQVMGNDGTTHGPITTSTVINNTLAQALFSYPLGLIASNSGSTYTADATTGQAVGFFNQGGAIAGVQAGANTGQTFSFATNVIAFGGPCDIFAAAGTYTVSVQFKSTGTVTALNRKLWVQAVSFS